MKTLVVQLARLGDILQTWPVLSALKRQALGEIHFLHRSGFSDACLGLKDVVLHTLSAPSILGPILVEQPDFNQSTQQISQLLTSLKAEKFDRIINLSFSPLSSYIVQALADTKSDTALSTDDKTGNNTDNDTVTRVEGFSRHSDGFLNIPDDASAYFYAQTGPGLFNRIHMTDLMATIAGVELTHEDFFHPQRATDGNPRQGIVIHIGASQKAKTLGRDKWTSLIRGLLKEEETQVYLIGKGPEEERVATEIEMILGQPTRLQNRVNQLKWIETCDLIARARLLVGCDSSPVHLATLLNIPVFNMSLPTVNFWETGPRSEGSRILPMSDEDEFDSQFILQEIARQLKNEDSDPKVIWWDSSLGTYVGAELHESFGWRLLKALYMQGDFPEPESREFWMAIEQLQGANSICPLQFAALQRDPKNREAAALLDQVDAVLGKIGELVPEAGCIVRWFETERVRLGPLPFGELLQRTAEIHSRFADVLSYYRPIESSATLAKDGPDVRK